MDDVVSCIIPSYKRVNMLKRAIDSVLFQTYREIEILVVDDNIPGDEYSIQIEKIVEDYSQENRVILVKQPVHINGAEARNAGIRAAKGNWIAFLDDDDEWLPTKIERQMSALKFNPDCMGVSCYYNTYLDGKIVHSCPPYTTDNLNMKILCRQVAMYMSTLIFRKDKLLEFGAFDNKLRRHQDLQLLAEFTIRNKMLLVPEILVNLHNDSFINRPSLFQFIEVKNQFFKSIESVLCLYSKADQRVIRNAHYYEVVNSAIKSKHFFVALKYITKAGFCLKSIKMLIQRIKEKNYIVY